MDVRPPKTVSHENRGGLPRRVDSASVGARSLRQVRGGQGLREVFEQVFTIRRLLEILPVALTSLVVGAT